MTDIAELSPNLGLPFYQTKLNEFEVQHNEALLMLDALVMLAVIDRDLSAPPSTPAYGDRYLVKATGTGDFAGKDNRIAQYDIGGWNFYAPQVGWTCYVQDEHVLLAWDGASWEPALDVLGGISEIQSLSLLGVGITADSANPLSAKLNNVLWTAKTVAEGGDGTLRYKLSKEDAAKTLSFLFQDNFSGRAEIGLTGDDDFHFKTSPDGSAWIDALTLNKTTGAASLNSALMLTGDITPSQITADQNDYNPAGLSTAAVLRLSSNASRNITGLSGGADGRMATIVNVGTNAIVLKDANTSSSAANRFSFGADVTLAGKQSAMLWYDATDSRWKLLAGPQATGGGSGPADLDITLAELALGLADALNTATFLGSTGNRFADSFDALTYVDVAGATNLNSSTAGLLKPSSAASDAVSVALNADIGGWGSYSYRQAFDASAVGATGGSVQVSFEGPASGSTVISNAYIGLQSGSYAFTATPARITFSGGSSSVTLGAGQTVVSDAITFTVPSSTGLVISFDSSSTTIRAKNTSTAGCHFYYKSGTGDAATVAASGYSDYTSSASAAVAKRIQAGSGANNLTVRSTALTAASAPVAMKVVAQVNEIDSITLGTDLLFEVTRDGGTTWTAATMSERFTCGSIHVLESASTDVSSQPTGTSVRWRVRTANNKWAEIQGIYIYWS